MESISSPRGWRARSFALALAGSAVFAMALIPGLAQAKRFHVKAMSVAEMRAQAKNDPDLGTLSPAARQALSQGYLVPNQERYERQKQRATRKAVARSRLTEPLNGPLAPATIRKWNGINDTNSAPPDETSAVGTQRYIELINSKFAIYNKTTNAPIGQGTLNQLTGAAAGLSVFDPQIMWDATTNRFYYATDVVQSDTVNFLAYGFSKTASPTSAADWCKYILGTGAQFYDYPKLGDSRFFSIIGANVFAADGSFLGSDVLAIDKPGAGTGCPSLTGHFDNLGSPLKTSASSFAFTPVPASEIDTNNTGWMVARTLNLPSTKLGVFKITRNNAGDPVFQNPGTQVTVPSYTAPANAPQKGSTRRLDTLDGRNTQAQAAVDPNRDNKFALWTQHTVKGGAGAQVRWYEINPAAHSVLQKGTVTSGSLFEFNGAIAPNRRVQGNTKSGGNAMLMNFNTSSTNAFPSIRMVSKVGNGAQSGQVSVFNGTKPLGGFDCSNAAPAPCRWGDYAAATPDPSTANRIWNVSQYGNGSASTAGPATSRTYNFVAKP